MRNQQKHQRGFSLIEILISILVMSFGLLGIGGLMMSGVNNATGSELASKATQHANAMMDAMRANPPTSPTDNKYRWNNWGASYSTLSNGSVEHNDLKQWLIDLRALPGGDGIIELFPANNTNFQYRITVRYANCIGTRNQDEVNACVNATNNSDKRNLEFHFKI